METYDKDAEKFVAENIIKQAGNEMLKGLIDNNGEGEFDVFGRIASSSKWFLFGLEPNQIVKIVKG